MVPFKEASRAVKMPRSSDPPSTRNPTAVALFRSGKITRPNPVLAELVSSEAPLPMNKSAPVMRILSNSPFRRATVPETSGSSTPVTNERLTLMVALPNTTSAMLNPAEPPIWNVGSVARRSTAASTSGFTAWKDWVQSNTAVPVETRFNRKKRSTPMSLTTSTPCNCALPKAPSRPVYFRTVPSA